MKIYKYLLTASLLFSAFLAKTQKMAIESEDYSNQSIEMADAMRANGKIYVLVAIVLLIFIGFIFYAIKTEQKVKKLEKELEDKN
ncbi:hypothetical protein GCM10027429_06200 [Marivirga atlantica]|jgi:hypothetical protein|uniref:CcmD family protein n=1 Tax=Marivirga atlantica TaxID=1548457 RepID=UPI001F253C15|nr:hypothetical protein [Marivirga atlantica]